MPESSRRDWDRFVMMVKEYRYGICTWVHEVWFVKTAKGNAGIVRYMYLVDGMVEGTLGRAE